MLTDVQCLGDIDCYWFAAVWST